MPTLRVVIAARIPFVREGLRALLSGEGDFQVTALAPSDELLDDLAAETPDVVLLDVQVLEHEGWELLHALGRAEPGVTTIVLGDSGQDRRVATALRLGARGYLLRDATADELANAIRAARSGTIVLHPQLAVNWLQTPERTADTGSAADEPLEGGGLIEPLSERELQVLRLLARGLANKQIAADLFITENTVKFHIRAILGKLGASNRTEAVTLALQKGLVSL